MSWWPWIASNILLASFLALAAWFALRRLRRPGLAHVLAVLALVKLITPPLVSLPLSEPTACELGTCGCPGHSPPQSQFGETLPGLFLGVWLFGGVATAGIAWRRWTRFRNLLAHASPAPKEWQRLATRLASELSLRRPPEILAAPGRLPPLVVPCRPRPILLLPMDLLDQLDGPQRESLLLHELTHLRRGDHWVRMLELTVAVAYWWLPLVSWIGRLMRECEEACCDAAVVNHRPQARRDYARLLLDVLEFANPLPRRTAPQATAMSAAKGLEERLRAILDAPIRTRRTWPAGVLAAGLACAVLPFELHYDFRSHSTPAAALPIVPDNSTKTPAIKRIDACCCPSS